MALGDITGPKYNQTTGALLTETNATITTGDIEIGAVEIKNGADDTRATVKAASTPPAATDTSLVAGIADGNLVSLGAKADSAQTDATQAASLMSFIKGLVSKIPQKNSVNVSLTRPSDTTAYAALDTIGTSLAITGASNASPIVITSTGHGLSDGDPITIASVGGNTNANGNYYAKRTGYTADTFVLYTDKALTTPRAGNSDFTSGGTIAKLFRFVNLARALGGTGIIAKAQIFTSQKTCTARFKLHLFTTPPTIILDNSPYLSLIANKLTRIGQIIFPACATEDPTSSDNANAIISLDGVGSNLPMLYLADSTERDVYGMLETLDAFTPDSAQTFDIRLGVIND